VSRLLVAVLANLLPVCSWGDVTVAVASNFSRTAAELAARFAGTTGTTVRISNGSTGKLYAQIVNGAPYDLFLSADTRRPELLERAGIAVAGSRFTYASGSLVLWSRNPRFKTEACRETLARGDYRHIALANPATAPYGNAAREFLIAIRSWETARHKAVYGESVGQALHFVASGNATIGLVARSQTADPELPEATCSWPVPTDLHGPIE